MYKLLEIRRQDATREEGTTASFPGWVLQWNLWTKDTLGAELLSSLWRLSFGRRFKPICNL